MSLEPPVVHAPDLREVAWLQEPAPRTKEDLRGQVGLVHFWDFTCINCLRTFPSLRVWNEHYRPAGLTLLGIHTPEFAFARNPAFVRAACGRLGIRWPVALDNEQTIWTAFANAVWPSLYLIDPAGYLRFRHQGEGGYPEIEAALRSLLMESGIPPDSLPPRAAGGPRGAGAACLPTTPELQAEALGNGILEDAGDAAEFSLPASRPEGAFYLGGSWSLFDRGLTLTSAGGDIVLPFQADSVHAVLSPFPGPGNPSPAPSDPRQVEVLVDGDPVPPGKFGLDLRRRRAATAVLVDTPRSYDLATGLGTGPHELRLHIESPGLTLYAFSFGACLDPSLAFRSPAC